MTRTAELFKYDVRVRDRLLRGGGLREADVQRHLEALVDVGDSASIVELKQPALYRPEPERRTQPPAAPKPAAVETPVTLQQAAPVALELPPPIAPPQAPPAAPPIATSEAGFGPAPTAVEPPVAPPAEAEPAPAAVAPPPPEPTPAPTQPVATPAPPDEAATESAAVDDEWGA